MSAYTDLDKIENSRSCLRRIARHDEQQFSKDSIVNVMEKFVKSVNQMDETILVPCRLMDRQVGDSTDIVQAPSKNSTSNQLTLNTFDSNGKAHKKRSKNIHEFLNSAELFNLYTTLNSLKNDLLWNRTDSSDDIDHVEEDEGIAQKEEISTTTTTSTELTGTSGSTNSLSTSASASTSSTGNNKGHVRRPSTASMTSTTSVSNLSDSESEISNENDSGVESEGNYGNKGDSKNAGVDKATELARQCRRHLAGLYHCLEQMTEASKYLTARYQNDIGPV